MAEFQTMVQCLQHWTKKLGDAPAFIFRNKLHERYVLTWNKLYALSGRFAAVLRGWGLTRGQLVVNTLPNSPERVVCEAGILMSGAASVNGHCMLADGSDLLRTLSVSRASTIVVDPDVDNSPWDVLKHHASLSDDGNSVTSESLPELKKVYFVRRVEDKGPGDFLGFLETQSDWFEADDTTADDAMSVFSTSGSTGFSKMVVYTHKMYMTYIDRFEYPIRSIYKDWRALFHISPLGWIGGYFGLPVWNGCTRTLCDIRGGMPEDMHEFIWRSIQEEKCTICVLIAVFLPRLIEIASSRNQGHGQITENDVTGDDVKDDDAFDARNSGTWKLDMLYTGGMPLTRSVVQKGLVLANTVTTAYGATDIGCISWLHVRNDDDFVDFDNGFPLKGVEVKIVREDDEGIEVPVNQMGHVLVRAQSAPHGYLNDPQMTAAAFTNDGYFRTGDVGRLDHRGHLIVDGRGGDAIMRGACIVYPGWLEARISTCPGVNSVMVVGVPDPDLQEELCACVVLESNDVKIAQVREFVEKDIVTKEDDPLSPRPRYYLKFESFPETSTHKPQRKMIMKMAAGMLGLSDSS